MTSSQTLMPPLYWLTDHFIISTGMEPGKLVFGSITGGQEKSAEYLYIRATNSSIALSTFHRHKIIEAEIFKTNF